LGRVPSSGADWRSVSDCSSPSSSAASSSPPWTVTVSSSSSSLRPDACSTRRMSVPSGNSSPYSAAVSNEAIAARSCTPSSSVSPIETTMSALITTPLSSSISTTSARLSDWRVGPPLLLIVPLPLVEPPTVDAVVAGRARMLCLLRHGRETRRRPATRLPAGYHRRVGRRVPRGGLARPAAGLLLDFLLGRVARLLQLIASVEGALAELLDGIAEL